MKTKRATSFSGFVEFPLKCFKIFGLIPHEDLNGSWKKKVLAVYHFVVIADLALAIFLMAVYIAKNYNDLALITESLPFSCYRILAIVKSFSIYRGKKEFKDLMETLRDLFPKTKKLQKSANVKEIFKNYKLMERIFAVLVSGVVVVFALVPIIKFILVGVWYERLPYKNWFPFDEYDPRYYNYVFIWEMFTSVISIASLMGPDLILYAFCTLISMQFDILSLQLRQLQQISSSEVHKKLAVLAELHKTLIRLSDNLETIYAASIFFNFLGGSVILCLLGFQIFVEISYENLVKFSVFLAASSVQILMLCYYGNKLTIASETVTEAAYDSGWNFNDSKIYKSYLLMMLQRSQRPTVLSAFKFSVVSLKSFTTVSIHKVKV